MRTFVIAEAAATHDGSLDQALRLVNLARVIGANAVKFQWCSSPERLAERRHAPEYLEVYQMLAFPSIWFPVLKTACTEAGLDFLCTAYLPEDIPVVAPYVARFKVSSFESRDQEFLSMHYRVDPTKPVIVSTGMHGEPGVDDYHFEYTNLHCVSAYPAPLDEMNLAVLRDGGFKGLSDHSRHEWTGALAVAAGAEIIEFHYRLDDTDPGNADYEVAFTPAEAARYVANIRLAERMLGDGVKRMQPSEIPYTKYVVRP